MKNFLRTVRIALHYRMTIGLIVFCSLMVALFWGANISTIYPVVDVVFRNKTIAQWAEDSADQLANKISRLDKEIATLEQGRKTLSAGQQHRRKRDIGALRQDLESAEKRHAWALWAVPLARQYLPNDPFRTLVALVAAILIGTTLKLVFLMTNLILVERLGQLTTFELRKQFYRQTLSMDLGAFGEDRTSILMSRFTNDVNATKSGITVLFGKTIREPLKMVVCMGLAGAISWRLLLLCLVVSPVGILIIGRLSKSLKRANRRAMEEMALLYGHLSETFTGIQSVKAFTMERHERNQFHAMAKEYYRKAMRIAAYNALTRPVTEMMGMAIICSAILAGGYLVLAQETHLLGLRMSNEPLSVGAMITFYALLVGVTDPARKMADVFASMQKAAAGCDRIFEMMDREPAIRDPEKPRPMPTDNISLSFEDVHFGYSPEHPVLRGVTLRIPHGQTVAIVGSNGCGKSTLINLVSRFFDPNVGAVCINGDDIRELRLKDLRKQIGVVAQQTHLFDDTVMNNIRYGTTEATDEDVIAASKQALAHRFVESDLEKGYQTVVGERGGKLSGGQRQRIALARAILRDPSLLILDEATSQVDIESEQVIHQALKRFVVGRTTIMITHRLSTLELADRIIVMEAGSIVDDGSHDELIRRCVLYQRLYQNDLKASA